MVSYRIHRDVPLAEEIRRIARDQVDRALCELEREDRDAAVHAARRRCKKVRALLRLIRGADEELYRRENAAFRDAARGTAGARDLAVAVETLDKLVASFDEGVVAPGAFDAVRTSLVERVERASATIDDDAVRFRTDLEAARIRIASWDPPVHGFDDLAVGLARTYRRCRRRFTDAYEQPTTVAFHEWRKRVKYHRYHLRLLQGCWSPVLAAHRQELHALGELLGHDHDLAVLRSDLHDEPGRFGGVELVGALTGLLDRRRADLQVQAHHLGARCVAEPTGQLVRRIGTYWQAWHDEADTALLADATVPPGH